MDLGFAVLKGLPNVSVVLVTQGLTCFKVGFQCDLSEWCCGGYFKK